MSQEQNIPKTTVGQNNVEDISSVEKVTLTEGTTPVKEEKTIDTDNQHLQIEKPKQWKYISTHTMLLIVTHPKKWTEYLLEFFMLFLAVFLGFVAEYIRENSVEYKRGHEYADRLLADLKKIPYGSIKKIKAGKAATHP